MTKTNMGREGDKSNRLSRLGILAGTALAALSGANIAATGALAAKAAEAPTLNDQESRLLDLFRGLDPVRQDRAIMSLEAIGDGEDSAERGIYTHLDGSRWHISSVETDRALYTFSTGVTLLAIERCGGSAA